MGDSNKKDIYVELFKDLDDKLSNKIDETTQCVRELDKKVELQGQKFTYEVESIKNLDEQQNQILEHHVRRTDALEKDIQLRETVMDKRVSKLEAPMRWLSGTKTVFITLGALAGAAYAIYKFFF